MCEPVYLLAEKLGSGTLEHAVTVALHIRTTKVQYRMKTKNMVDGYVRIAGIAGNVSDSGVLLPFKQDWWPQWRGIAAARFRVPALWAQESRSGEKSEARGIIHENPRTRKELSSRKLLSYTRRSIRPTAVLNPRCERCACLHILCLLREERCLWA